MVTEKPNDMELLSVGEAAEAVGLSRRRFQTLRRTYPLAHYRFGPKGWPRFKRADLEAWLERFRMDDGPPPPPNVSNPRGRGAKTGGRKNWSGIR
jgi:excisionase family DNA binding protein